MDLDEQNLIIEFQSTSVNDDFSKNIDLEPLAETWECSTHPDGLSVVASGEHSGLNLKEVLKKYPEYVNAVRLPERTTPIRLWYMHNQTVCTIIDVHEMKKEIRNLPLSVLGTE